MEQGPSDDPETGINMGCILFKVHQQFTCGYIIKYVLYALPRRNYMRCIQNKFTVFYLCILSIYMHVFIMPIVIMDVCLCVVMTM